MRCDRQRPVYLLAVYRAVLGFEAIWRLGANGEWIAALVFQCHGVTQQVRGLDGSWLLDADLRGAHLIFFFQSFD